MLHMQCKPLYLVNMARQFCKTMYIVLLDQIVPCNRLSGDIHLRLSTKCFPVN